MVRYGSILVLLSCVGCSALTKVSSPDVVQPNAAADPQGADALRVGAVRTFYDWISAEDDGAVTYSGLVTDELASGDPTTAATSEIDARRLADPDPLGPGLYTGLHRARVAMLQAVAAEQRFNPQERAVIGELFAFSGYAEVWFAEMWCAGVPLSTNVNGEPVYGSPLTTDQMLTQALADFDSATAYAGDSSRITNLAHVGRARALVDASRFAEAATAASSVPTAYVFATEHSGSVQPNGVARAFADLRYSVADHEGANGLAFRTASDPRVSTTSLGTGQDGITTIYEFNAYASLAAPIPLASGVEARLIEAEAALQGGNVGAWLADLNTARAAQGLPPAADPGDSASRISLQFSERAFSLFLTAHRLGDLRRLIRQYGRNPETVFPTGTYKDGLPRGSDVNFGIPITEQNNPAFHHCLDRNA